MASKNVSNTVTVDGKSVYLLGDYFKGNVIEMIVCVCISLK